MALIWPLSFGAIQSDSIRNNKQEVQRMPVANIEPLAVYA